VFELIERFSNYGFNKAHSVSYALITYQMAYIKANYPLAFFASILNNQTLNDFKVIKFRQEFTYFGINLKLPSIIESKKEMTFKDNSLIISTIFLLSCFLSTAFIAST
jgi:DNA polymerase-3 subunit alpha